MHRSKRHNAYFIHVPKTGGTTIRTSIAKYGFNSFNLHQAKDKSNDDKTGAYKLGTVRRAKRGINQEDWENNFKFAFVRNPYSRAVSNYYFLNFYKKMNFNDFLKKELTQNKDIWHHKLTQSEHLYDENKNITIDFIGRFENIQEDFDKICKKLKIPCFKLPHKKSSKIDENRKKCLTEENKKIIYDLYKEDFINFNYPE